MINVKELENRWLKYKTKSLILITFMITIVGLLIYGGYYILYKLDFGTKREHKKAVMSAVRVVDEKNSSIATPLPTPIPSHIPTKEPKKDIIQLAPIVPIVDIDDSREVNKKRVKRIIKYKKKLVRKKIKSKKYIKPKVVVKKKIEKDEIEHKIKKIDFKVTTNNYMKIMKDKFNRNKNPRDALLIAKAYYRAGNYKKSEIWALKANNLNKESEESWLLFAKSKDALGKREETLKILIAYYNKTKSPNAKLLIEKISSKSI